MDNLQNGPHDSATRTRTVSRRGFFGAGGIAAAAIPLQPVLEVMNPPLDAAIVPTNGNKRTEASFTYRLQTAQAEHNSPGGQLDNGDAQRFTDFSGNYCKALSHDALGIPNKAAMQSLMNAFEAGQFSDFENILVGTPGGGP